MKNVKVGAKVVVKRLRHEILQRAPGVVVGGPTTLSNQRFWTVRVDDTGKTVVVDELSICASDPDTKFCPECEEKDYFLPEDYLCAACRFVLWEDQDSRA